MPTCTLKVKELKQKYPDYETDFILKWRTIIKEALAGQISRCPSSASLRGIKKIVRRHWPTYTNDEVDKVAEMISTKFNSHKLLPDWDSYRAILPNIFPESIVGQLAFTENEDGNYLMSQIPKPSTNDVCVVIIRGSKLNAQFTDVPQDTAYSILSELSKSLA
jgi:hypothetical protein